MITKTEPFKRFPEFSKLTLADKPAYEAYVKDLPPVDDISFSELMCWWNPLDNISVSELNGNLVIPYWMPGAEKHSGLSLVGTNDVDASIATIFDYQRSRGEKPRLVNVPGFVVGNIQFPELFHFKEQKRHNEYVYDIARFYPLRQMPFYWRRKVQRKLDRVGDVSTLRSLDLRESENRELLLHAMTEWAPKGHNNIGKVEADTLHLTIDNAAELDIENVCLFVEGKLHGFCVYTISADKRYASVKHIKATDKSSLGFEYIAYHVARRFNEQGVRYVNLNTDHGIMHLRMFMLALGPHSFFYKYAIEPR